MKEKVVIGLSGGVDSTVAALLLKEQGYEVIGISMKLFEYTCMQPREDSCCSPESLNEAKRICQKIGIPYYTVDFAKEFQEDIIEYFKDTYIEGRTPNPCIVCNEKIKFGIFLKKAKELGAKYLATGHYCQIEFDKDGNALLKKGLDVKKDQSYMLHCLTQEQLKHILLPVGKLDKESVRKIALDNGFSVHDKKDSQEICFIEQGDYRDFLKRYKKFKKGNFVDTKGNILGKHNGYPFYTIGQRKGLGLALKTPHYVINIDPIKNEVILGERELLMKKEFEIKNINIIDQSLLNKNDFKCSVKIRYTARDKSCTVRKLENGLYRIELDEHTFDAITPGQFAVLYNDNYVLGGGEIV